MTPFALYLSLSVAVLAVFPTPAAAQDATIRVDVRAAGQPLAGAVVIVDGQTQMTGAEGIATVHVPSGAVHITVTKAGYAAATVSVHAVTDQPRHVIVELSAQPVVEEEVTVVSSTRTERRVDDQPMRVEVLVREEIEEKMLMTPGDIVMLLNEMGGMRVQATAPSFGASSVRIQGMRGRYTRFLSDGLLLFGEQAGLGLLQIPPMDLGQVEVIKGVASALYGAGAMGGVVNLISRRPGAEPEREVLVNRTTRGGTDAVWWLATPLDRTWGVTLLGGGHWQDQHDVDGDNWSDIPGYARAIVRPRVFWDGGNGRSFFATAGATWEDRTGGTQPGRVLPAIGQPYIEAVETRRADAGLLGQTLLGDRYVLTARAAISQQRHDHRFGEVVERDRHTTAFGEVALRGASGVHTWVVGAAVEHDRYSPRDVPRFAYSHTVPGVFVQDDLDVSDWLSVSVSGRLDRHSAYGTFFSPRVSALTKTGGWTSRVSLGGGFFAPTPLVEETEAAGLTRLTIAGDLRAERGRSVSVDLARVHGPASYTFTVFGSRVAHPVHVDRTAYVLGNLAQPTSNVGVEVLGIVRHAPVAVTGSYTYVRAREADGGMRADVPLTPRHSAGVVAMAESEDAGRLGVEVYFTGEQRLELNPYRERSEPYWLVGLLAERRFGGLRLFVNLENITGVWQTNYDPLLRPNRAADGRWTVDAWAPLEGRVINGGIRVAF